MHPNVAPPDPDYTKFFYGMLLGSWHGLKIVWPYLLLLAIVWSFKVGLAQRLFRRWRDSLAHPHSAAVSGAFAGGLPVSPPICPSCNVAMVRRVASQGKHKGEPFYGCPNYPKCKQLVSVAQYSDMTGKH
jgi:hypothetical protein